MAASEPISERDSIVAALVPGDGRPRFCQTKRTGATTGDWVVIDSPFGVEPGQIVFAVDRVDVPSTIEIVASIVRNMTIAEILELDTNMLRSLSVIGEAARVAEMIDPSIQLRNLRFTLDGSRILCTCHGDAADPPAQLDRELSATLGCPVVVEWRERPAQSFGSLGRIRVRDATTEEKVIRHRLRIDDAESTLAPNGWPRLGSRVGTVDGAGVMVGVSIRHNTAIVRLDSGDETVVPVVNLTKAKD